MIHEQDVYVSYSQVCVFDSSLESPFNDWTDADVAKYSSAREHSISFRTEQESGRYSIEVADEERLDSYGNLIRCIECQLTISRNGMIEVASISDGFQVASPIIGTIKVRFEEFVGNKIRITLLQSNTIE